MSAIPPQPTAPVRLRRAAPLVAAVLAVVASAGGRAQEGATSYHPVFRPTAATTEAIGLQLPEGAERPPARPVHAVPFATAGNAVELAVRSAAPEAGNEATRTEQPAPRLVVRVAEAPPWARVEPAALDLGAVPAGADALARFALALTAEAPVGDPAPVRFAVVAVLPLGPTGGPGGTGRTAEVVVGYKEVWLEAAPPLAFRALAARPNPTRGRVAVAYELPRAAESVRFEVYDVLGRRVAAREDGTRAAGRHEASWDGAVAAGVYVWRLTARYDGGEGSAGAGRFTVVE